MNARTLDFVLRRDADGEWKGAGLTLPTARVLAVMNERGTSIPFELREGVVTVRGDPISLVARVELTEDLVAASALERSRIDLEREKVASAERLGRRTLWVTAATAVTSAAATIAVATIAAPSGKPEKAQPSAYRDLSECHDGLADLGTLSALDGQTLPDLRAAVRRQVDECNRRLAAAMAASPP